MSKRTVEVADGLRWVRGPSGRNYLLEGDGFYLSYNPDTSDLGFFRGDGTDETALCIGGRFYVLNGDHRTDYEGAFNAGAAACLAVYERLRDAHRSSWSTA